MDKPQFSYSYDEEAYHGRYNSALEAAMAALESIDRNCCWVGENSAIKAADCVNANSILDDVACAADDMAGEAAEGWLAPLRTPEMRAEFETLVAEWIAARAPVTFWMVSHPQKWVRGDIGPMPVEG